VSLLVTKIKSITEILKIIEIIEIIEVLETLEIFEKIESPVITEQEEVTITIDKCLETPMIE